jgi:hypothetical protein
VHIPFDADFHRKGDVQDALTLSPGQQEIVVTLATPVKALMATTQIAETIQKGVDSFMEAVPPLMDALDAVAKIHPFIGGASPFSRITGLMTTYQPSCRSCIQGCIHAREQTTRE